MNFQQLEYIVAVATHRHFGKAAEACFVTQPTLSMMIQRLESELELRIFDRGKQPVELTPDGRLVVEQARRILSEAERLRELVREQREEVSGAIRLGIIPTLAPYLLPLFAHPLITRYPGLTLEVEELTTRTIINRLRGGALDVGLLVTPVQETGLRERPLFYERFFAYVSENEPQFHKEYLLPNQIDLGKLWILEEGHCFRSQVLNLCQLSKDRRLEEQLKIEAGSFETVMRLVEHYHGLTIIPELLVNQLPEEKRGRVRAFAAPAPVREVSLVMLDYFPRHRLLDALQEVIQEVLPPGISRTRGAERIVEVTVDPAPRRG